MTLQDLIESFESALAWIGPYPALQAAAIAVVFLAIAKIVEAILCGLIARAVRRTRSNFDDQLVAILHQPLFATLAIFGLVLATWRLDFGDPAEHLTVATLKTIIVFVWLRFALRFLQMILAVLSRESDRAAFIQPATLPLLNNVAALAVVLTGIYAGLLAWDIDVTGIVASAGIVGLALSFAAKDTLANIFAGVAILADRPYAIGDYVILDSGERGKVTNIGLRSTRLLTRDDVEVTVPNGVIGAAKIVNETGGPHEKYRARVQVGVAYGSDIDRVQSVLQAVADNHDEVCARPAPRVRFRRFGDSSLDFELLVWIPEPELRGRLVHELNCEVYHQFELTGIEIPFPQQDVHVRSMPSGQS
jgi:small-conductance mechanosensitive channel